MGTKYFKLLILVRYKQQKDQCYENTQPRLKSEISVVEFCGKGLQLLQQGCSTLHSSNLPHEIYYLTWIYLSSECSVHLNIYSQHILTHSSL
jgi:hypothetical protein